MLSASGPLLTISLEQLYLFAAGFRGEKTHLGALHGIESFHVNCIDRKSVV